MNVLEKILEEIEERFEYLRKADDACRIYAESDRNFEGMKYFQNLMFATDRAKSIVEEIIRSHMDEAENDGWIPVEERLPKEHQSMFVKFQNTPNWSNGMFEKISDKVNVTIELEDGTRKTTTSYTIDGKWKVEKEQQIIKKKVIAWRSIPGPYKPKKTIPVAGMDHIMSRFTKVK